MKIEKSKTKAVKACDDVAVVAEVPVVEDVVIDECPCEECCQTIDFGYVRNSVKDIIDYLSQFENDLAKETVGNLAYIYLDLTDAIK